MPYADISTGKLEISGLTSSDVVQLVDLASAAYSSTYNVSPNVQVSGWAAITPNLTDEIYGLDESYIVQFGDAFRVETDSLIPWAADAEATVFENEDSNRIVVAFRGTEPDSTDPEDWPDIANHANEFNPLMDAVIAYAIKNSIGEVWFTGHSLGAGVTEIMMERYNDGFSGLNFKAVAVASPLASRNSGDARVLNIGHESDVVYSLVGLKGDNSVSNLYAVFDDFSVFPDIDILDVDNQHSHQVYVYTTDTLLRSQFYDATDRNSVVIVDYTSQWQEITELTTGGFSDQPSLILGQDEEISYHWLEDGEKYTISPDDYLIGGGADDMIEGFSGNDILRGDAVFLGWGGNDTLSGGEGADIFLGTFAELDGDTITDLEVGDRIFYKGVTFDANAISVDDSSITVSLSGLTSSISTEIPFGAGLSVYNGVSLDGNDGTWIEVEQFSTANVEVQAAARVDQSESLELPRSTEEFYRFNDGMVQDEENPTLTEGNYDPPETVSVSDWGRTADVDFDLQTARISASVHTPNSESTLERPSGEAEASASFQDTVVITNADVESGEVWRIGFTFSLEALAESGYLADGSPLAYVNARLIIIDPVTQNSIDIDFRRIPEGTFGGEPIEDTFLTTVTIRQDGVYTETETSSNLISVALDVSRPTVGLSFDFSADAYARAGSHRYYDDSSASISASVGLDFESSGITLSTGSGILFSDSPYSVDGAVDIVASESDIPEVMVLAEQSVEGVGGTLSGESGNTRLNGSDGDDTLTDMDGHNQFEGGSGDDVMRSGDGNDVHSGGTGSDDIESGSGNDYVDGGADDDRIVDGNGHDLLLGGTGGDVIILEGSGYHGAGYVAFNVSSDTQVGTQERARLEGLVQIEAVTDGGTGFDTVQLSDEGDAFFLHDAFSGFHSSVDLEGDYIGRESAARFAGIEVINGLGGNDIIDLTSPDYSLAGTSLTINGGSGNDIIWGSDADESISGGAGDDTIFGGTGNDVVSGGLGADVFEFTRTSTGTTIADFDLLEGDSLRFYNTGGAEFLADSAALTDTGGQISYVDTATGQTHVLDIAITFENRDDYPRLGSLSDVFEII